MREAEQSNFPHIPCPKASITQGLDSIARLLGKLNTRVPSFLLSTGAVRRASAAFSALECFAAASALPFFSPGLDRGIDHNSDHLKNSKRHDPRADSTANVSDPKTLMMRTLVYESIEGTVDKPIDSSVRSSVLPSPPHADVVRYGDAVAVAVPASEMRYIWQEPASLVGGSPLFAPV